MRETSGRIHLLARNLSRDKATSRSIRNLPNIWNKPAKEALVPHEVPSLPWEKVGTDLFAFKNRSYVTTFHYYSNFWEVDKLPDTKTRTVILKVKNHFARYRCPDKVLSAKGPQFSCNEIRNVCSDLAIRALHHQPWKQRGERKSSYLL